jgi:hypothetical protein
MPNRPALSLVILVALTVGLAVRAPRTCAQTAGDCQFPDFSSTTGLRLLGTAAQAENRLRLSRSDEHVLAGAAYCETKQPVGRGFETTFTFQISDLVACCGRPPGADGFTFIIQNSSLDAIGAPGGALGYAQIANSLVVEFDTFANDFDAIGDPNDNHISIHTNGVGPNSPNESSSIGLAANLPSLKDGAVHTVVIQYEPGSLRVYLDDRSRPTVTAAVNLAETLDLEDGTSAWTGFTSSTGSASETTDLLSWTTTFLDPVAAALDWDEPDTDAAGPPQNLTARLVGSATKRAPLATHAAATTVAGEAVAQRAELIGYKVYTSTSPNVQPIPSNLFTSVPPSQTSTTAPIAPGGSFFIVTACYDSGESGPSNEANAGQPGAAIQKVKLKPTKLVAKGVGFTDSVLVLVDGIPFVADAVVKQRVKVVQASTLLTGENLSQYVARKSSVEIAFINNDQRITRVRYP